MDETKKKRIVLVSHNDLLGGAAIVTFRLMKALRAMGHEADMLVFNKLGDDPNVHLISNHFTRSTRFLAERARIWLNNGRSRENLFKVSTALTGLPIASHPLVKAADAVLLGWINQATVSLDEIAALSRTGKKIIWTMHDMWCMTGICHLANDCTRFKDSCGNCPWLGSGAKEDDLSRRIQKKKRRLYEQADITFVAVSNWLRQQALDSKLLGDKEIKVIPNAFPSNIFTPEIDPTKGIIPNSPFKNVIAFGAANLEDPVKGLKYAFEALNFIYDEWPEIAAGAVAVFFGEVHDPDLFKRLKFPHIVAGTVSNQNSLQHIYANSKVVLSTSLFEMLSGTLIEGMSCGAIPVTFGRGGHADIIDHKVNGYIAEYLNPRDIAEGIRWAFNADIDRNLLHQTVADRFDASKIASRYLDLIDSPT